MDSKAPLLEKQQEVSNYIDEIMVASVPSFSFCLAST